MAEEPIGQSEHDEDAPMSLRAKIVAGVVAALVLVASAWVLMRVSSPPISPTDAPPAGHYPFSCTLCHTVSADAGGKAVR